MLIVIIAGLVSYIVVDRWQRREEARRQEAVWARAAAEAEQARVQAQQIRAFPEAGIESQSPAGESPTRSTAGERREDAP